MRAEGSRAAYQSVFQEAMSAFCWRRGPEGTAYDVPFYQHPLMSPFFLDARKTSSRAIERVESLYAAQAGRRRLRSIAVESPRPLTAERTAPFRARSYAMSRLWVASFRRPRPLGLKAGYRIVVGDHADRRLAEDSRRLTLACFEGTRGIAAILRKNRLLTRDLRFRARTLTANIYDRRGALAATGSVSCAKSVGWLFAACVRAGERKKGLWRSLLSVRQALASGLGADRCLLVTGHDYLATAADDRSRLTVFTPPKR